MFTVKATYRNETRKFTFDSSYFPSFKDISEQLVKVFPIPQSFFLSRLEFCPVQGLPGSFMIAAQVLSEEQYNQVIAIQGHRAWPGALLRFTVEDTFPDQGFNPLWSPVGSKRKGKDVDDKFPKRFSCYTDSSSTSFSQVTPGSWASFSQRKLPTPPPPVIYSVPVPPPPIIYPSPGFHTSQVPMDVDPTPSQRQPVGVSAHLPVPQNEAHTPAACCDVSQGKRDLHEAMVEFTNTITRVMKTLDPNLTIPGTPSVPAVDAEVAAAPHTSTADPTRNHTPSIPGSFTEPTPVHEGILCDICSCTIRGVRHKCLDCPDYDMCTPCITNRRHEHPSSHEFFVIEQPGHVIVHTVFSGESDSRHSSTRSSPEARAANSAPSSPVVHHALCDLCDSRIRGNRYKCLNCPDFDTCESCFTITSDQHPDHSFVLIKDSNSLIIRKKHKLRHSADCDGCQKPINGVRYKCMSCPDFDLCENCEAHPIPVHPPTHHMLKLKTPHAAIPSPAPATHIARTSSTSTGIEPTTTQDFSVEVTGVDSAPVVRTPITVLPPSQSNESDNVAMSVPESLRTPSVPDLITFPEMSETQNVPTSISPQPEVRSTVPLVQDSNDLVEVPSYSCGSTFVYSSPIAVSLPQVSENAAGTDVMNPVKFTRPPTPNDNQRLCDPIESPPRSSTPYIPGSLTPSDVSSAPRIANFSTEQWRDLWPEMKDMLNSILQPTPVIIANTGSTTNASVSTLPAPVIRPMIYAKLPSDVPTRTINTPTDLASVIAEEDVPTLSSPVGNSASELTPASPSRVVQSSTPSNSNGTRSVEVEAPLRATFISDNNIPDGQIFPPGAEFVKSWKMLNDGTRDWPETSQLMFVAGDKLTTANDQGIVEIGRVPAGVEIDVWTGEMKAPEVPGKYVSYWRLNDGRGNHFGHSLWADITVAEPQKAADTSDGGSLASSAVIMPQSAPEKSSALSENKRPVPATSISVATTDTLSDMASDDSDISVVDMPSSPSLSSSDSVEWEDTMEHITPPQTTIEYVVLYDDSSDDEMI